MIFNQQRRVRIDTRALRACLERVQAALRIGRKEINVCIVNDAAIRRLNHRFRGRPKATDVLSFPWRRYDEEGSSTARTAKDGVRGEQDEFRNFLGDVAISAETAARNARREGYSTEQEVRMLILHGTLHLLGYDHETDDGRMARLELRLRDRLGMGANGRGPARRRKMRRQ